MILNTPENMLKITQVGEDILGTCKGLAEVISDVFGEDIQLEDLSIELLQELDDITMECSCCGWWVEPSEFTDDNICTNCAEDD